MTRLTLESMVPVSLRSCGGTLSITTTFALKFGGARLRRNARVLFALGESSVGSRCRRATHPSGLLVGGEQVPALLRAEVLRGLLAEVDPHRNVGANGAHLVAPMGRRSSKTSSSRSVSVGASLQTRPKWRASSKAARRTTLSRRPSPSLAEK